MDLSQRTRRPRGRSLPDYVTSVGGFYGWPPSYFGQPLRRNCCRFGSTDLAYRYEFLKNFAGFGRQDAAAIRKALPQLIEQQPEIVEEQYEKLLAYDAMAIHFVERPRGQGGPQPESLAGLSADGAVKFRRDHITPRVFELLQSKFDLKLVESEPPREMFEFARA